MLEDGATDGAQARTVVLAILEVRRGGMSGEEDDIKGIETLEAREVPFGLDRARDLRGSVHRRRPVHPRRS